MVLGLGAAATAAVVWWYRARSRKPPPTPPDYSSDGAWFRRDITGTKEADCFYLHPTTEVGLLAWNIPYNEYSINAHGRCNGPISGDPDMMEGQAGAFDCCNLWAPRYSQLGLLAQMVDLGHAGDAKLERVQASIYVALADVLRAFIAFLETRPDKTRPFVIAAHSQGSWLMTKVIKDCLEDSPYRRYFVAAYLAGGYVPQDLFGSVFHNIHVCGGPEVRSCNVRGCSSVVQFTRCGWNGLERFGTVGTGVVRMRRRRCTHLQDTGCIISFDTRVKGFVPEGLQKLGIPGLGVWPHHIYWLTHDRYCAKPVGMDDTSKPRVQISPLTWKAAGGGVHLGANASFKSKVPGRSAPVVPPAGYGEKTEVSAMAVLVEDPGSWLGKGVGSKGGPNNMHPIDVHFWFYNIRENVPKRIQAWVRRNR